MTHFLGIEKQTFRLLTAIAVPMVISQGTHAAMIFTDRYFMGLISPTHMAAALGGGVAAIACLSLALGILAYGNALVAQYYGAGQLNLEKSVGRSSADTMPA